MAGPYGGNKAGRAVLAWTRSNQILFRTRRAGMPRCRSARWNACNRGMFLLNGRDQLARSRPSTGGGRLAWVDMVRGLAVCGMVLFHLDWDLAYLRWIDASPSGSLAWTAFGNIVAGTFLFLSGLGLALAGHRGWRFALRRAGFIGGVALAITAVTRWIFPQDYIFFGILHCIAVTNLIALPFVRSPIGALAAAAALAAVAPLVFASAAFDGPWWWWLGLSRSLPRTLDYRPVLPWLGLVLLGLAFGRYRPALGAWHPRGFPARALDLTGRHSLFVYVAHQPALLGLLFVAGLVRGPPPSDWSLAFSRQCFRQCTSAGAGARGCNAACECVRSRLETSRTGQATPTPLHVPTQQDLDAVSVACLRETPVETAPRRAPGEMGAK